MIYLSGPITMRPGENLKLFSLYTRELRRSGFEVYSPAEHEIEDDWDQLLRGDIKVLMECNAVVLLDGWETSRGSKLEVYIAQAIRMPTIPVGTILTDTTFYLEKLNVPAEV